ncbi:MAG: DUF6702 family protein [Flavobacteriales bacterium]
MKLLTCSLILSLFNWWNAPLPSSDHEYYFSVMTMEKNEQAGSLEVEFRLFSDDLEMALGESDDYHMRLGDEREVPEADSLIMNYILENVEIEGYGWARMKEVYVGKEVDNDITYVYVEYTGVSEWGDVEVTNTILFDEFENQQNQITYINGTSIKSESTFYAYPRRVFDLGS